MTPSVFGQEPQKVIINSIEMKSVPIPRGTSIRSSPFDEEGEYEDETRREVSPTKRRKWFGRPYANFGFSTIKVLAKSEIKLSQQRGVLQLTIALERYECRQGTHPDLLERLVPEFQAELPIDHHSKEGSFGYQKLD